MKQVVSDLMILNRENPYEVRVEGFVIFDRDSSYGEDADGNRGTCRITVEAIEDLQAFDDDGNEIILTEHEAALADQLLTVKFLEG